MDLENSLITTWKDTQVLGVCLLCPTSETPGWGHSCAHPKSPYPHLGKDVPSIISAVPTTLRLPPRGEAAPASQDTTCTPGKVGCAQRPQQHHTSALPAALPGRGPHHRGVPGAEGARLLRHPEGESHSRAVPEQVRRVLIFLFSFAFSQSWD